MWPSGGKGAIRKTLVLQTAPLHFAQLMKMKSIDVYGTKCSCYVPKIIEIN